MSHNLLKLRQKYQQLLHYNCEEILANKKILNDINIELQKNMDYDWMLQSQRNKIDHQLSIMNKRIRDFSKIINHDTKIMNKLLEIKKTLKEQQKSIISIQEEHFFEISQDFELINKKLCKHIIKKSSSNAYFKKITIALHKSNSNFIEYCKNWKNKELSYYINISQSSKFILEELANTIEMLNSTEHSNQVLYSKCINLSHYIENVKTQYPKITFYKNSLLKHLDLKATMQSYLNRENPHLNFLTHNIDDIILDKISLIDKLKQYPPIFHEIYHQSNKIIRKIEHEKLKMDKIAIDSEEFQISLIKDWLSHHPNSTPFVFSQYLSERKIELDL